jgi:hypothetical protein
MMHAREKSDFAIVAERPRGNAMKRDFQQGLAKLESQASVRRDWLLWLAVAYYLGNPTEVDSQFEAYAHALGYPSWNELKQAHEKESSEVEAREVSDVRKTIG